MKPKLVGRTKCEGCAAYFDWPHEGWNRPIAICPSCGALTKVGTRPRLADYNSQAFTDSDNWNPWLPNCGEFNIDERERRKKEGSIRWNPVTKAWSGYFENRQQYRQWLNDKGVTNGWGEGNINPDKQRWGRSNEEVEKEYRERYREKA